MGQIFVSPAKINLFLRVLHKRSDGYHELASLFQAIDWSDRLTFTWAKEDRFTCDCPQLPVDGHNLVTRAVALFRKYHPLPPVAIHLEKRIPLQAGLGGGSSNAATTLFALNSMVGFPYADEELALWSAELGSDVPFFFSTGIAYCTGRGEKVHTLAPLALPPYRLHFPSFGLPTPVVFSALHADDYTHGAPPQTLLDSFMRGQGHYHNDLEAVACRVEPALADFRAALVAQGHTPYMTGSGSTFFSIDNGQGKAPLYRSRGAWYGDGQG